MTEIITIRQLTPSDRDGDAAYASYDSKNNRLKSWICSNKHFAKMDLGDRQKKFYDELFHDGWNVVCEWEKE